MTGYLLLMTIGLAAALPRLNMNEAKSREVKKAIVAEIVNETLEKRSRFEKNDFEVLILVEK